MARYPDNHFDLAIVDPPYGIDGNSHRNNQSRSKLAVAKKYDTFLWDQEAPKPAYFKELNRVSKKQIIFGINYFNHKSLSSSGRIVWDKVNGEADFSDAEIAYCSWIESVRVVHFMWSGMMQGATIGRSRSVMQGNKKLNEVRIHPTQKPVKLYEWLLVNFAKPGYKILDTHLGSGSSAIACHNLHFDLTACEVVKKHYDDVMERIRLETKTLTINY